MKYLALITILTLGLATVASTQAGEPLYLPDRVTNVDHIGPRSPHTALAASLAGTVLPIAAGVALATGDDPPAGGAVSAGLIGFGLIIGPSLGYAYGGIGSRGVSGVGVRAGLVALTATAAMIGGSASSGDGWEGLETALGITALGVGLIGLQAVFDIARVPHHVQKRNRELARRRLSLSPAYFGSTGASGLQLTVDF